MRHLLLVAIVACVVPPAALAGERLLGTLTVSDGGTIANRTTGTTFIVPPLEKITVQCDEASWFLTDVATCSATTCLRIAALEKLPTSVNASKALTGYSYNADAGPGIAVTYTGGWVASMPVSGATSTCQVFSVKGDET